ncbi:hypothetical protein ABK040_005712 [Willaertia magna]
MNNYNLHNSSFPQNNNTTNNNAALFVQTITNPNNMQTLSNHILLDSRNNIRNDNFNYTNEIPIQDQYSYIQKTTPQQNPNNSSLICSSTSNNNNYIVSLNAPHHSNSPHYININTNSNHPQFYNNVNTLDNNISQLNSPSVSYLSFQNTPSNINKSDSIIDLTKNNKDEPCVVVKLPLSMYYKLVDFMNGKTSPSSSSFSNPRPVESISNDNMSPSFRKNVKQIEDESYHIKGSWTEEEDKKLLDLVQNHGAKRWSFIAQGLPGRVGKQCRERYLNHLDPKINKKAWTEEEDAVIVEMHEKHGNQWAKISRVLEGRTANAVKNHWNSTLSKKLEKLKKGEIDDGTVSSGENPQYPANITPNQSPNVEKQQNIVTDTAPYQTHNIVIPSTGQNMIIQNQQPILENIHKSRNINSQHDLPVVQETNEMFSPQSEKRLFSSFSGTPTNYEQIKKQREVSSVKLEGNNQAHQDNVEQQSSVPKFKEKFKHLRLSLTADNDNNNSSIVYPTNPTNSISLTVPSLDSNIPIGSTGLTPRHGDLMNEGIGNNGTNMTPSHQLFTPSNFSEWLPDADLFSSPRSARNALNNNQQQMN